MKRLLSFVLALSLCFALTACWESESSETPDFWEIEQEPVVTDAETPDKPVYFTLPYLSSQTLDPIACSDGAQQVVASLLYEGLFALDAQFVPQPVLCASYSLSSNKLTYTFRLRDDATFSNGSALTASDVLAAYRRAQASERYAARFENIASLRASRGAFVITLRQADSAFPALLDIPIVKSGTEKDSVPLGTGPYRFVNEEGDAFLVRNETWWQGTALPCERIALAPAKDEDTAVYLFSAERSHLLIADLLGDSTASALGGVDLIDAPTTTMLFIGFNTKKPELANAALRAAMGTAFDRSAVVETLLAGHAAAAQFPLSPASPLYPATLETPYNAGTYAAALEQAMSAGAEGEPPLELTLLVNEENSFKTALASHLAAQLSTTRISVTPRSLPWADYLAALEGGDFDLWLGEVRLTADWDVAPLVGSGGALNYGGYANPALDKALRAFLADENETTITAFYELFAQEAPILPVVFKSVSLLAPQGMLENASPTASRPLAGFGGWTIHLPE